MINEQERLFRMETEANPTEQQVLMDAFIAECSLYDTPSLVALREAELETLSNAEQRVMRLNVMIDDRQA